MMMEPDIDRATEVDRRLLLADHASAMGPWMFAWSKTIRTALGLPVASLADRLGISQQAATKLEANEASGAITLAKMHELAAALGCDLVYGFVPKRPLRKQACATQARRDAARKGKRKIPRTA